MTINNKVGAIYVFIYKKDNTVSRFYNHLLPLL